MPTTAVKPRPSHLGGDHLDTPVRDVMTAGVVTISEDASLAQVLRALRAHEVHAVLVSGSRHGKPLGWITARGLLAWMGSDASLVRARDLVTEQPQTIDPLATAREAVVALSRAETTHLLVASRDDRAPEGVLTAVNLVALEQG
jgi:CBS domain-containing protein